MKTKAFWWIDREITDFKAELENKTFVCLIGTFGTNLNQIEVDFFGI